MSSKTKFSILWANPNTVVQCAWHSWDQTSGANSRIMLEVVQPYGDSSYIASKQSLSARPQEALRWIQRLSIHLGWERNKPCHLSWHELTEFSGLYDAKSQSPSINLWGRAGMEPKRSSGQWSWTHGRTLWIRVVIMLSRVFKHFLFCCFFGGGSGKIHKTLLCFSCNLTVLQENALLCPACNVKKYQVLGVKSKVWNRISGYPIPWIPGCPSHGAVKSAG